MSGSKYLTSNRSVVSGGPKQLYRSNPTEELPGLKLLQNLMLTLIIRCQNARFITARCRIVKLPMLNPKAGMDHGSVEEGGLVSFSFTPCRQLQYSRCVSFVYTWGNGGTRTPHRQQEWKDMLLMCWCHVPEHTQWWRASLNQLTAALTVNRSPHNTRQVVLMLWMISDHLIVPTPESWPYVWLTARSMNCMTWMLKPKEGQVLNENSLGECSIIKSLHLDMYTNPAPVSLQIVSSQGIETSASLMYRTALCLPTCQTNLCDTEL